MHTPFLVILDIDGTLADFKHREHLIDDPKQFLNPELMIQDPVFEKSIPVLNKLGEDKASLVVLTRT